MKLKFTEYISDGSEVNQIQKNHKDLDNMLPYFEKDNTLYFFICHQAMLENRNDVMDKMEVIMEDDELFVKVLKAKLGELYKIFRSKFAKFMATCIYVSIINPNTKLRLKCYKKYRAGRSKMIKRRGRYIFIEKD